MLRPFPTCLADTKNRELRDYQKRLEVMEDGILDYEGTIAQFRELVLSMQTDLEDLRESHQTHQNESQTLSSQSQTMLNLNMKLQSTILHNRSNNIEFELRKFEAAQAKQKLNILTVS